MIEALTGSNWFAIKSALDQRVLAFKEEFGELAIEKIYAAEASTAQIMAAVNEQSLFSADKLVVITQLSANKEASERIDQLISSASGKTRVILVETNLDKRSVYYKTLKKMKNFEEYNELSEDALAAWAVEYAASGGGTLSPSDARYLIERVGGGQTVLERELAKLILYTKYITRTEIDLLTESTPTSTIFNLVESAFGGNLGRALNLYDEQRALKVEPQAIFGMLVWQMHLVAMCAAAGTRNGNEIAAETGLKPYSVGKAKDIARQMGTSRVDAFLTLLRDVEITSKRQTYDLDDGIKYAIETLAHG